MPVLRSGDRARHAGIRGPGYRSGKRLRIGSGRSWFPRTARRDLGLRRPRKGLFRFWDAGLVTVEHAILTNRPGASDHSVVLGWPDAADRSRDNRGSRAAERVKGHACPLQSCCSSEKATQLRNCLILKGSFSLSAKLAFVSADSEWSSRKAPHRNRSDCLSIAASKHWARLAIQLMREQVGCQTRRR
jgi:hypothetical protein